MTFLAGVVLIAVGLMLLGSTSGKPNDWDPPLGRRVWWLGLPNASARDKIRAMAYIALAFGALQVIRALWFGA
jgi:hypothetical protein